MREGFFPTWSGSSQTNLVTRTSDAHRPLLSDLNFTIALRIVRFGLPSSGLFECPAEFTNALCILLVPLWPHQHGFCLPFEYH